MIERLAERIRQCAAIAGSGDELARMTGIPRRTLEYYLSGEREPKASRCVQIARAAGVEPGWLVSGEGPMRSDMREDCELLASCLQVELHDPEESAEGPSTLSLPPEWLGRPPEADHKLLAIRVEGDSMQPTLHSGDILLVDTSSRRIQDGQLFVLRDQCNLLIKRLQPALGGRVRVISDNPRYPEQLVYSQELEILGRVIWKGGCL